MPTSTYSPDQKIFATYQAIFRLATRPYGLSYASAGNDRKQLATLYHLSTSLRDVHIRRVQVAVESVSAATILWADFVKLTSAVTPATGNPAITPSVPFTTATGAAEATALALPTTPGTEGALLETVEWNLGITAAASTVNPPSSLNYIDLYNHLNEPEVQVSTLLKGVAGGFAVVMDSSVASTIVSHVIITFSER